MRVTDAMANQEIDHGISGAGEALGNGLIEAPRPSRLTRRNVTPEQRQAVIKFAQAMGVHIYATDLAFDAGPAEIAEHLAAFLRNRDGYDFLIYLYDRETGRMAVATDMDKETDNAET